MPRLCMVQEILLSMSQSISSDVIERNESNHRTLYERFTLISTTTTAYIHDTDNNAMAARVMAVPIKEIKSKGIVPAQRNANIHGGGFSS